MDKDKLKSLIDLGEGFTVEFKRSGTQNMGRELCAFANATGGSVLIGVSDHGEIVGVKDHNKLKSQIQSIARSMEPPIVVDIESVENVLVISVPEQHGKPYSFAGKFYLRDGASSQQMLRDEIREFFFKEGVIHFDETPCDDYLPERDLRPLIWERFSKKAHIPEGMPPHAALENLHLMKKGTMTHAGAWLLTDDITRFTISGNVSCALFMGSDKAKILDRKDFSGDVYSMISDAMAYILSKINTELIIGKVDREERPELPEAALREAVVNALAHRDYRSTANVQVYIFKDRIEIVSPGGLPAGMTKEDLGKKSVPRNPLLFSMLYRMNAVEHIGSGINRIHEACKTYGVKPPHVLVEDSWVSIVFNRPPAEKEHAMQDTMQAAMQDTMQADREKMILDFCDSAKSREEIQNHIGIKNRDYFRKEILNPLIKKGLLKLTLPEKPNSPKQRYYRNKDAAGY